MKIYDYEGNLTNWSWVQETFGPVSIDDVGEKQYEVSTFWARTGPSALVVKVVDQNDVPLEGVRVAFYWPDAPVDADAGWYGRCVVGKTEVSGCVGFGMGQGAYYEPWKGTKGPHAVWVYGPGVSQRVDGLGMIWATNHNHIDVEFKVYVDDGGNGPCDCPEFPEEEVRAIAANIDGMIAGYEEVKNNLANIKAVLSGLVDG